MLTEDYLMRLIRLATQVFLRILGLKSQGLYQDALYAIDQMLEQITGLRADLLQRLDDDSLINAFSTANGLDADRLILAADFIQQQAEIYALTGQPDEARSLSLRALNCYLAAMLEASPSEVPAPDEKIQILVDTLGLQALPPATLVRLFDYFAGSGVYNRADQVLTSLSYLPEADGGEFRRMKLDFYRRLMEQDDEALQRGNLPRAVVEKRIAALSRETGQM